MSFLQYFFTRTDASHPKGDADESIESNRNRLVRVRENHIKHCAGLDLGRRVTQLDKQLAEAGVVIETLIELLEERVGLSRKEIEDRIENLTVTPELITEQHAAEIPELPPPAPPVLTVKDEKEPFQPRRRWRDARGQF